MFFNLFLDIKFHKNNLSPFWEENFWKYNRKFEGYFDNKFKHLLNLQHKYSWKENWYLHYHERSVTWSIAVILYSKCVVLIIQNLINLYQNISKYNWRSLNDMKISLDYLLSFTYLIFFTVCSVCLNYDWIPHEHPSGN